MGRLVLDCRPAAAASSHRSDELASSFPLKTLAAVMAATHHKIVRVLSDSITKKVRNSIYETSDRHRLRYRRGPTTQFNPSGVKGVGEHVSAPVSTALALPWDEFARCAPSVGGKRRPCRAQANKMKSTMLTRLGASTTKVMIPGGSGCDGSV